jgi:putative Mg2+ transporter-C (MgtC) family protein
MDYLVPEKLVAFWSLPAVRTNIIILLNILGALLLGLLVGYERSYHGRAAGMRTYGLVCMASTALTVLTGYPEYWFGGEAVRSAGADPTRVIQGIVTGVGFLGAGVIMKEGLNISGLTTAASIWLAAAIGVVLGVGFYAAGVLLALLSAVCMMWGARLERWLPSRPAVAVTLKYREGFVPQESVLCEVARKRGYEVATGSLAIKFADGCPVWHFVAVEVSRGRGVSLPHLAEELARFEGVVSFELSHARN